jgi:hypothetical protein
MSFSIKKLTNGFAVLYNDKPVLVGKDNKFAIPNTLIKIESEEPIPTKAMLVVAMSKPHDMLWELCKLGAEYMFTYTSSGVKTDSIKLFEKNLGDMSGSHTTFM